MSSAHIQSFFSRVQRTISPLGMLNRIADKSALVRRIAVPYGVGPRRRLDVYAPISPGPWPIVVFFYGGGWEEGDRQDYRFVGAALAESGLVTIIPDYRVFPEVRFPGFLEDAATAVQWAIAHGTRHGGDPSRVVLVGHSAGAHIATMLALDRQWLESAGAPHGMVKGLVGLAGPYDFQPDTPNRRLIFGDPADYARTQPISFVGPHAPPALLATGAHDRIVDPGNSQRLALRLEAAGVPVTLRLYPHASHETILGAFSPILRLIAPTLADSIAFIRSTTGAPSAQAIAPCPSI